MKAMLEPRIVAASTHDSEFLAHGAANVPARMIGSSHGCLMQSVDAKRTPPDSLDQIIFVNGKKRTGGGQFSTFLLHLALTIVPPNPAWRVPGQPLCSSVSSVVSDFNSGIC